jgi:hypothetical protein
VHSYEGDAGVGAAPVNAGEQAQHPALTAPAHVATDTVHSAVHAHETSHAGRSHGPMFQQEYN